MFGEGDEVVVLMVDHCDLGAPDVDLGVDGLLQSGTPFLVRSPTAVVREFQTTESSVRWFMIHSVDRPFIFPIVGEFFERLVCLRSFFFDALQPLGDLSNRPGEIL